MDLKKYKFPPHPEKDLLWFFINYAPLEDWEKDVLDIIREEAYYFYPQKMTKIANEGWSSYWHAELMYKYKNIIPQEHMDFARDHERVVQAGGNPFRIYSNFRYPFNYRGGLFHNNRGHKRCFLIFY